MVDFESVIRDWVSGEVSGVSSFEDGLQHETFQVEYGESEVVVFQFAVSEGRERDLLYKNAFWYDKLDGLGLPLPSVRSDGVCRVGDAWFLVTDCLSGENAERDVTRERCRNAGGHLARLHESVEVDGVKFLDVEGTDVSLVSSDYDDWICGMFEESIERFRENGVKEFAGDLADVQGEFERSVPSGFESVVCHNDYSPDNVLFDGSEVTGIVDFDIAYVGDRFRDVVDGANGFWMHEPMADWSPRNVFYEGYEEEYELGDGFWEAERFYRFETLVVTVSYLVDLGVLTDSQVEFYAGEIRDALARFESG